MITGVRSVGVYVGDQDRAAMFKDPDGNTYGLGLSGQ